MPRLSTISDDTILLPRMKIPPPLLARRLCRHGDVLLTYDNDDDEGYGGISIDGVRKIAS